MAIKLKFLGGTREIGRSAIAVKNSEHNILLDYGALVDREPGFPVHISPRDVDAIIVTHSHLDHTGAIPQFHIRAKIPVYGAQLTFELTELLISDFLHISGYYLPYEYIDLQSMLENSISLEYGEARKFGNIEFKLLNAGHIPGSAQVLLHIQGRTILYTGDLNVIDTRLLNGADLVSDEVDVLVIESTYADEDHEDRRELEKRFVERLIDVVGRGGIALVPAFSVGRAQEILCVLTAYKFPYLITLDGMARKASKILMRFPQFLKDQRLFLDAMRKARWVRGKKDRQKSSETAGVVVAPAGMLKGGVAIFYMEKLASKKENAVFLVGYQVPGTPGYELLKTHRFIIGGESKKVEAEVDRFDFSSHCGRGQLCEFIKGLKGNPKVFTVHGAEGNCELLAKTIKEEIGLDAHAPISGEVVCI